MFKLANHRERFENEQAYQKFAAPGFKQAMHGLCLTCHRLEEKDPADELSRGNCLGCHRAYKPEQAAAEKLP